MPHDKAVVLSACVSVDGARPDYEKFSARPPNECAERLAEGDSSEPIDERLARLLTEAQKRTGCDVAAAMRHVSKSHPALVAEYRRSFLTVV